MSFLSEGKELEIEFSKLFSNVKFSTKEEDINEHWDVEVDYNDGIRKKIDVKGLKKQNRYDVIPTENFHWVELTNVNGGEQSGSLYGKADFFAFQTEDYWLLVDKMKLQLLIEKKCEGKKIEKTKNPYSLYQRDGRKDIIVKVKTLDLFYIADRILVKKKD